MLLSLVILTLVIWAIVFRYKQRRLFELAAKIPSFSDALPFIGITHRIIGPSASYTHFMSYMNKLTLECINLGGLTRFWLSLKVYIMMTNPADVDKLLKYCQEKEDIYKFFRNLIGNGVLFARFAIWKARRKHVVPAFAPNVIDSFLNVFVQQSMILVEQLKPLCGSEEFSIEPYLNRHSLQSILESTLDVSKNVQEDEKMRFLDIFERGVNLAIERIFHIWLHPESIYKLFYKKYAEHEYCRRHGENFIDKILLKRIKELDAEETAKPGSEGNKPLNSSNATFVDNLIKSFSDKSFTNVEIREELFSIILAATDTTAIAIANTMVLLKMYPKIQEKAHQELASIFGDSDRPIAKEDLLKLKYLERVIKESLRLYPPVPFVVRNITNEISLPSGCILPSGSVVIVNIWGIHRDPKHWGPDADCFDPDRFLPERLNLPYTSCFLPFIHGPRNCIGAYYAMQSIKVVLATVLRNYKIVGKPEEGPVPHMQMKFQVTMKAADGWRVALERK